MLSVLSFVNELITGLPCWIIKLVAINKLENGLSWNKHFILVVLEVIVVSVVLLHQDIWLVFFHSSIKRMIDTPTSYKEMKFRNSQNKSSTRLYSPSNIFLLFIISIKLSQLSIPQGSKPLEEMSDTY